MGQKFFISLKNSAAAAVCAAIVAAAVSASAKEGETRTCETKLGGQVVCGDYVVGITLEQYEAGLKRRAEEIRGEEAEKRVQLQNLMQKQVELTERATSAEKESLRSQIAAVEAEKRALDAESKGVADRLANSQASYDGLVQKLAEANAALEAFAPLISTEAFAQAQAMLSRGDVLGAERKFVEIADTVRKIKEKADVVEARAIFEAGKLAEERIDWRAASAHYARAARLQPSNWQYAQRAGKLARLMGDYTGAAFLETPSKKPL
jgi:tetratricopeptide (TPR) repeat protein